MDFLKENLIYVAPILGVVGLIVMFIKASWVSKQKAGDKKMQTLAGHIADGAMAFLKAEWRVLSVFSLSLETMGKHFLTIMPPPSSFSFT